MASILEGAGTLYQAVTDAALKGMDNNEQIRELDRKLHDLRRGITQQMDEARSELAFSRFNQHTYQAVVDLADQVRRRLTAMAQDQSLYVQAQLQPQLVPSLPTLAEVTMRSFASAAAALRHPPTNLDPWPLDTALCELDADLARLRSQRATAPLPLDQMLPFWALVFN